MSKFQKLGVLTSEGVKMKKIFLLNLVLLTSCSNISEEDIRITYLDYPEELMISWGQSLIQEEKDYYLYYYSNNCGHCLEFKEEFLFSLSCFLYTMYLVNTEEYVVFDKNESDLIGISDIDKLFIPGTPTVLEIINHKVANYFIGTNEISILMNNK